MRLPHLILLIGLGLPAAAATAADDAAQSGAKPARPSASSCIDVEVNGYRGPSYDCLSQQMAPRTPAPHENPAMASENIAKRPPNELGLANRAATSNRMGNTFGKSAFPQRPPAKVYSPVAPPTR